MGKRWYLSHMGHNSVPLQIKKVDGLWSCAGRTATTYAELRSQLYQLLFRESHKHGINLWINPVDVNEEILTYNHLHWTSWNKRYFCANKIQTKLEYMGCGLWSFAGKTYHREEAIQAAKEWEQQSPLHFVLVASHQFKFGEFDESSEPLLPDSYNCNLQHVEMNTHDIQMTGCSIIHADLTECRGFLYMSQVHHCSVYGEVQISGCTISSCRLKDVDLVNVYATSCHITNVTLCNHARIIKTHWWREIP